LRARERERRERNRESERGGREIERDSQAPSAEEAIGESGQEKEASKSGQQDRD
jgi:hypothetical protein